MKMPVMRTLAQIHLEDLEPHRFEDLVRQLLYDFRRWRALEATGRSGGDSGFDARGREIVTLDTVESEALSAEDQIDDDSETLSDERLWLIQCKCEKTIGPAKATKYINDLAPACKPTPPYGIVFVAACDLSKSTRDAILKEARGLGFMEIHIWAKGEIEDLLYQPKNDHLLFAYTGISLQIRRQAVRTEVRSKISAKRKLTRMLKDAHLVLVLEASDNRFPFPSGPAGGHWSLRRHWNVYYPGRCAWDGYRVILRHCWAIFDPETGDWDIDESSDTGRPGEHNDPWCEPEATIKRAHDRWELWSKQGYKQALYVEEQVIPYETVIDIDAEVDLLFKGPAIHVDDFHPTNGPFLAGIRRHIEPVDRFVGWSRSAPDPERRKALFASAGTERSSGESVTIET